MKKPKRKAAPIPHGMDRRINPADAPFNGETAERRVRDPFSPDGAHIVVTASLRDDPLGRLFKRKQIDDALFAAGHYMQSMFELAEVGAVKAMDFSKPAVDGRGQFVEPITDKQRRAVKRLSEAREALGKRGYQLVREVLAERKFIEHVAKSRGLTERETKYLGARFRECLETVADVFGFTGTAPAARRVRDEHATNARFANHPELHRAMAAAKDFQPVTVPAVRVGETTLTLSSEGEAA